MQPVIAGSAISQAGHPHMQPLQRSSPSARNCFICMDRLEGKAITALKCSHEMCSSCWQTWVVTKIKDACLRQKEKREVRCPLCRRYTPVSADQTAQAEHELNNEGYRKQPVNNLWIQSSTRAESFVAPLPASVQPAAPNLNRTGTLFSSGLDISRSVRNGQDFRGLADGPDVLQGSHGEGNPAVLSLISDGQSLRQALGICPHGHHRSMCRLCDPAGAAERERLQVQGAFDVDPAGTPLRCQSVCTLS